MSFSSPADGNRHYSWSCVRAFQMCFSQLQEISSHACADWAVLSTPRGTSAFLRTSPRVVLCPTNLSYLGLPRRSAPCPQLSQGSQALSVFHFPVQQRWNVKAVSDLDHPKAPSLTCPFSGIRVLCCVTRRALQAVFDYLLSGLYFLVFWLFQAWG